MNDNDPEEGEEFTDFVISQWRGFLALLAFVLIAALAVWLGVFVGGYR